MHIDDITIIRTLPTGVGFAINSKGEQAYIPSSAKSLSEEDEGQTFSAVLVENNHPNANGRDVNSTPTPWKVMRFFTPLNERKPSSNCEAPEEPRLAPPEVRIENALRPDVLLTAPEIARFALIAERTELETVTLVRNVLMRLQADGRASSIKTFTGKNTQRASDV